MWWQLNGPTGHWVLTGQYDQTIILKVSAPKSPDLEDYGWGGGWGWVRGVLHAAVRAPHCPTVTPSLSIRETSPALVYIAIRDRQDGWKMLYLTSTGWTGTLRNGHFKIFLRDSNRYSGKHPMKWPILDTDLPSIWHFFNVSQWKSYICLFQTGQGRSGWLQGCCI